MKKIRHAQFRSVKAIIGSFEVDFDHEGTAIVEDETAASIRNIPGFHIMPESEPAPVKQPVEVQSSEISETAQPEESPAPDEPEVPADSVLIRQPVAQPAKGGKKPGRPRKVQ